MMSNLYTWMVRMGILVYLFWKDFFDPLVTAVPCGCGELYPAGNCVRCHGTGLRHRPARRVTMWKQKNQK
jgi:hypothetical protein